MNTFPYSRLRFLIVGAMSFLLMSILNSCGTKKKTMSEVHRPVKTHVAQKTTSTSKTTPPKVHHTAKSARSDVMEQTREYVKNYADIAEKKMKEHRIPASITLAQGILESGRGTSTLTRQSNNHFGIKCHKNWHGPRVFYDDDKKGECFRAYDNPEGSFEDHSRFLVGKQRYAFLFDLPKGDYISWAFGLKKAGYATDPKYPLKLIDIIEKNELYLYDKEILGKQYEKESKNTLYYTVKAGDNLNKISKAKGIPVEKIMEYNKLSDANNLSIGQLILLKPMTYLRDAIPDSPVLTNGGEKITFPTAPHPTVKAQGTDPDFHIVKEGETLFGIARVYRIPLRKLKLFNHLTSSKIQPGQKIFLKPGLYAVEQKKKELEKLQENENPEDNNEEVREENEENEVKEVPLVIREDTGNAVDSITTKPKPQVEVKPVVEEVSKPLKPQTPTPMVNQQQSLPDYHIVKEGETLYSIAYKYDLEVPLLRRINHVKKNEVYIGQKIYLKENVAQLEQTIPVNNKLKGEKPVEHTVKHPVHASQVDVPGTYTVKKGETLYRISKKFGISIQRLKELNHLSDNTIYVGQVLYIK